MAISDALRDMLKQGRSKYQSRVNSKVIKAKEGKTRIRILPGPTDDSLFYADLGVHWIKASETGKPMAVVGCHEKVYDQPCPVCSAIETAILSATDTDTEKLYKSWRSRKTGLVNVIVRDGADKSDVAQIMELPATAMEQIIGNVQTYMDDDIWALDPSTGVDFIIERRGKGYDTEYSVTIPPKSVPLTQAQLDSRIDLDAYIAQEHFRGDEQKALNAIAQITGVAVNTNKAALSNGRATQSALTSSVASGAEDFAEEVPFDVEEPTAVEAPKLGKKAAAAKVVQKPAPTSVADSAADAAEEDDDDFEAQLKKELDSLSI